MAYVIHGANETLGGTTVDVTINVGSSSGRKAIAFVSAQEGAFGVTSSIVRDPGGDDEAFTLIRAEDLFNSGDAIYLLHAHRLDLTATGSQTFRATVSASSARLYLMILVWDDLATGAPEANEYASFTGGGVSSISDSITTSTDGAVIVSGVVFRVTSGAETAPYWTPDNGQTERVDAAVDGRVTVAMGDLVLATAGAQTIGWTGDSAADVGGQILLAFAPATSGETGDITEGAGLGDTFDALMARLGELTEGVGLGETMDPAIGVGTSEGVGLGETLTADRNRAGAITEGAGLGDSFVGAAEATGALTEGAGLGESFDPTMARLGDLGEGVGVGETFDGLVARLEAITEAVGLGLALGTAVTTDWPDLSVGLGDDFASDRARTGALTEGAGLGDTFESAAESTGAITEGAGLGDTYSVAAARLGLLQEGAGLNASFDTVMARLAALTEAVGLGDTFVGAVAGEGSRTIEAGAGLGDAFAAVLALLDALEAGVGLSDSYALARGRMGAVSESVGLGESFAAILAASASMSESVGLGASFRYGIALVPTIDRTVRARGRGFFVRSRR